MDKITIAEFQEKAMNCMDDLWEQVYNEDKHIYDGYTLRIHCKTELPDLMQSVNHGRIPLPDVWEDDPTIYWEMDDA